MSKPETIKIDDVEYVRKDSRSEPLQYEGWDYCIVRSLEQGVVCGYVESINGRTVKLHQARQMWKWDSSFVLQDIAEKGVRNPYNCKFSVAMSQPMYMLEACGVMTCTKIAAESLISLKAQEK